jgi:NTE family protein
MTRSALPQDTGSDAPASPRPRVGLVIGSGGIKCAAATGLWRVLCREGIPVDTVVGCSGGAFYAAGIGLGFDPDQVHELTMASWDRRNTGRLYPRALMRVLFPRTLGFNSRIGLVDDSRFMPTFRKVFGDATFAETVRPLFLTATDLQNGERVVLSEGRIIDAIRASVAIPVLFRPWEIDGRLLVDGGMSDPLPVSVAIQERCDVIIAMGFTEPSIPNVSSLPSLINQVTSLTIANLLRSSFAFYSAVHHAEIISMMPAFDRPIRMGDTHLLPYIIEKGEEAAEAELPYLKRLLASAQPAP